RAREGASGISCDANGKHLPHSTNLESKILPDVLVERHWQARHSLRLEARQRRTQLVFSSAHAGKNIQTSVVTEALDSDACVRVDRSNGDAGNYRTTPICDYTVDAAH